MFLIATVLSDFDRRMDEEIDSLLREVEDQATSTGPDDVPLYGLLRYHLGRVDEHFRPQQAYPGKRVRSRLAILTCAAAGGEVETAFPLASAIELIHNFTLIHDDVQDRSLERRHRRTIWSIWGEGQAINAGDAMFVISHLALNRLADSVEPRKVLELSNWLHNITLRIVEGQTLDLSFEERDDVTAAEYLTMIGGKTAAIMAFAAGAGAYLAGAAPSTVERFAEFGRALGIGFQVQDDLLGVWGTPEQTGKPVADDIRRRKKALPLILLAERLSNEDRTKLNEMLAADAICDDAVEQILKLMDEYGIEQATAAQVDTWHERAASLLNEVRCQQDVYPELERLVRSLSSRQI